MIKKIAVLFLMSAAAGIVYAQEATTTAVVPEQTVTISDLGVSETGILPTSPFYFFKEMGRGMQSFFTFNPVAKAELELKITNEKAAEIRKITETQSEKTGAIQKALENYQKSQENLRAKLENLKETSQNPKVDTLLNNLADRVVKHEKLFDEISLKFKEKKGISKAISDTTAGSENVIGEASKKDDPTKFASRLEKVLLEEKGGDLKNIRSVEMIDRLSNKTAATTKESLERLREEFSKKSEQDIQNFVKKNGENALKDEISNMPGDAAAKSVIIEEIQKRSTENFSRTLGKTMDQLQTSIDKEDDVSEKAKEQIKKAEEMIQEMEKKIRESKNQKIPETVSTLLTGTREHLESAKTSFAEEKYGEAFGQARSAEVLARNAIKFFERENQTPEAAELKQIRPDEKPTILPIRPSTDRCQEITKNILELKELFASKRIDEANFKIKYAARMRELIVCQEAKNAVAPLPPAILPAPASPIQTACTIDEKCESETVTQKSCGQIRCLRYEPVCATNGKTYSCGEADALSCGVKVAYSGECKIEIEKPESISPQPTTVKPIPATEKVIVE